MSAKVDGKARWQDYPLADDGSESVSLSGLVLHVLHKIDPKLDTEIDSLWLKDLPGSIPSLKDYEASAHVIVVDERQSQGVKDAVRYYKLPWLIVGTVDSYSNGSFFERLGAIMWVDRAVRHLGPSRKAVKKFNWIAAESLFALRYLAEGGGGSVQ